ncbi:MAG: hypothetical protein ABI947_27990 [Chloroflexota bacterium]
MQVASLAELREALRTAASGDIIDLAPGEYQGPILIDTAVTLRGRDRQTVLWRRGGPVVYVRTPGVRLDKLLIERTIQSQGPLVIHAANCTPIGRESRLLDALINLGELIPGSTVSLPLEIEVAAHTEISVSGLHGAQITPSAFEDKGKHLAWLTLDGSTLSRGEVLLGELAIRDPNATRYLWLAGSVSDPAPATLLTTARNFCLATKKTRLYPSPRGLMLDGAQLAVLDGVKAAPGIYAYVQHDPSGALFLYLPSEPPAPVTLNGQTLTRWNRVQLHEKDTLKIAGATFTVQAADPPPISVEPVVLTFADFAEQFPDPVTLTVHNGKTAWKGHVSAAVPWLSVAPEGDLRLPAQRSSAWTISLNSDVLALPDGVHEVFGGLLVVGSNHMIGADVRLAVHRPAVVLQIAPVDLGALEWGWPAERISDVVIGNFGRDSWTGTVRSTVSWLNIVTPMPFTCGSWSEGIVQVQAVPNWDVLPVGTYDLPNALIFTDPHGEQAVSIKLQVTPPQPHLVAVTHAALFDTVERNAPLPDTPIAVRNEGGAAWTGTIRAVNSWVRLSPAEITAEDPILPGATAEIEVHLLDVPAELALDTPVIIDEIRFENADSTLTTTLPIDVQLTVVELPPYLVANPITFVPFIKGDSPPEGVLRIHNNGPARWRGTITANTSLLTVPDNVFTCEPGDSIELPVTLNSTALEVLKTGLTHLDDALSVHGGREPITTSASIDLRDPIWELHLDTLTLNYGQIDGVLPELPSQIVRLVNAGPAIGTARVEICVPWLSVASNARLFDIDVPGNSVIEFAVTLNEEVRRLAPGTIVEDRAVVITGREQQMIVRALLVMNEWSPLLVVTPEKLTLTGDTAQTLTIRNTGKRIWTVQASAAAWLTATPSEITLDPGQAATIEVKLASVPPGQFSDPRAVVIVGSGREVEIEVGVRIAEQA